MLECVINVSEGRDRQVLDRLTGAVGPMLLDLHADPHHHRAVLTLAGPQEELEAAVRSVADAAVAELDLGRHRGVHPRLGVVDVVPFVALDATAPEVAVGARDRFARWWAGRGVPCFLYGAERTLPDVRREAFGRLAPDMGPAQPHPTAGATAVGARQPLVAYNVWVDGASAVEVARQVAREIRGPAVRALGLEVGDRAQVSTNLVAPDVVGPDVVFDRVARRVAELDGAEVAGAELVGLLPAAVLLAVPRERWQDLDLAEDRTIESRAAARRRGG